MKTLNHKILFLILLKSSIFIYSQSIELPKPTGTIITKEYYTLQYNEVYEQADWVCYNLTKEEVLGTAERKNSFKSDPEIISKSASLKDYAKSGYDRGHLAPAADMKMSKESMSDSFLMSNMSPQEPGFNRGIWSKLESYVRTWAVENGDIYIVTGPVFTTKEYKTIGENEVAIPDLYFKVILDYSGKEKKSIGFLLPNKKSSVPVQEYALSVNDIEDLTNINFFYILPDEIEEQLEKSFDISLWSFRRY